MCRPVLLFLTMAVVMVLGCSSSSSNGSPPTVKDLVLSPTTIDVNKPTDLNGSCTIEDPDGDIAGLSGELSFPDGHVVPLADMNLAAGSAKSAPVVIKIPSLTLPAVGEYTLSVYARDQAGNHSAKLPLKLTAK